VAAAGSPTVRRRRLAAELRRLRGNSRTGGEVARALGWSPAKISRYELGQGGFPLDEVGKLLDFYGVTEPRRTQLLTLATDANARGWWEDYADALTPEYVEFIGLEAEAYSESHFQVETVPGLLQTREYAWHIHNAVQSMVPTAPGVIERRVEVRGARQLVLTERTPPLELAAIIDESALLRKVGSRNTMRTQLLHIDKQAELPNVTMRVLPLQRDSSLMTGSFVIFGFNPQGALGAPLGDVVSTESVASEVYVEGETDTYAYRLVFQSLANAALPPDESRHLVRQIAEQVWV
jgi:transcriptional regulator with XRE-family HTH domain